MESPTPLHGERLPGAVHELAAAQDGLRRWMKSDLHRRRTQLVMWRPAYGAGHLFHP